tara:strand:- start:577 stop:1056 length:480 start_codon:yes stop_codon:yes gene_type:complete
MALFSGANGSLELEGVKIANVQNWSFTVNVQAAETSTLGTTDTTILPIKRTTTGSCRILYYQENAGSKSKTNSASAFISKIIKARKNDDATNRNLKQGSEAATENFSDLRLKVDDGSATGREIYMRILITSLTMTMTVGEIFAADIQFQSNGVVAGLDL